MGPRGFTGYTGYTGPKGPAGGGIRGVSGVIDLDTSSVSGSFSVAVDFSTLTSVVLTVARPHGSSVIYANLDSSATYYSNGSIVVGYDLSALPATDAYRLHYVILA
jgi:hypothetical protein